MGDLSRIRIHITYRSSTNRWVRHDRANLSLQGGYKNCEGYSFRAVGPGRELMLFWLEIPLASYEPFRKTLHEDFLLYLEPVV